MWFVNKERTCVRFAATPQKAERLRRWGFVPLETRRTASRRDKK